MEVDSPNYSFGGKNDKIKNWGYQFPKMNPTTIRSKLGLANIGNDDNNNTNGGAKEQKKAY